MSSSSTTENTTRGLQATGCPMVAERDDVTEEVTTALSATGRPSLRRLEVAASEGRIVLRGRVTSYYLKQLAQAAALAVPAVAQLLNEVEVVGGP
jgi:osmotically-inducible protein OsmY